MSHESISRLAALTGKARATVVSRLEGMEYTTEGNAKLYDSREALERIYAINVDGTSYEAQRTRLTKAQADHEELRVREKEGELIPAEAVNEAWVGHVMAARAILLGLPSKIAPVVMSAKTLREVEERARDEVYLALDQLAAKGETDAKGTQKAH